MSDTSLFNSSFDPLTYDEFVVSRVTFAIRCIRGDSIFRAGNSEARELASSFRVDSGECSLGRFEGEPLVKSLSLTV